MSLSPAIGTEVPEMANGVVIPVVSENGPHVSLSVKCGGSRATCPGEASEDGSPGHTDNHVYDGEGRLDTAMAINERISSLSLHTPWVTEPSLSTDTCTGDSESGSISRDIPGAANAVEPPGAALLWDSAQTKDSSQHEGPVSPDRQQTEAETLDGGTDSREEDEDEETEKQEEEEEDEKNENKWRTPYAGGRTKMNSSQHYSSSAPGPSTSSSSSPPPPLLPSDDAPCPPHVMAQVWVRNVRGMQDSKSLDEISQTCGGSVCARGGGRGGQSEGRRATISSALELEGTVSQEGDLTHFITKNLEQKIKMSSKPSLDCSDSDCSGPIYRSRGSSRRPADIPPIDTAVLLDLQRHTQEVAHSVEMMMRSLNGTIQNMTALSVGYIQTYRDSVDSLGESVDMSIKGMYTLMARCEELDRSMQPIHTLASQIRDIKRTLDALEAICK
ncbi:BLOC-1 related complex subunit 6 isoform X1 [Scophthalmus maximus]|uniref:BLOC-1 related complex subunit 6 isoform X1 n=1 Tax=Scophthalmus maximus TaxID=52904 RepID=UPI0015E06A77|nr:BLOC-1 related complex subunit 6 isoform X1 [Scophthalmus maximus]XP_035501054.1 BLOC-1 related complex subunit 6 isoform X1 [Scophthalmus maximus]XP_035501055.1 BLOC-1 related complex subunit 6 isoform X1 [Scophthalmus maximus]XP_035501056.1 BLOC-1 related complex subunit 6 isoform X1 [Scophthalmus maximus]